jgi:hypothetical protein
MWFFLPALFLRAIRRWLSYTYQFVPQLMKLHLLRPLPKVKLLRLRLLKVLLKQSPANTFLYALRLTFLYVRP